MFYYLQPLPSLNSPLLVQNSCRLFADTVSLLRNFGDPQVVSTSALSKLLPTIVLEIFSSLLAAHTHVVQLQNEKMKEVTKWLEKFPGGIDFHD